MSDERKPSDVTTVPWLRAERLAGEYPAQSVNGGKWLLFVPVAHVDKVWDQVRAATQAGLLGGASKVATAKPSPKGYNPATRVVCVYTYDWTDEADVMRVRAALRELGFVAKLSYKADEDSFAGHYSGRNKGRVAKYYA